MALKNTLLRICSPFSSNKKQQQQPQAGTKPAADPAPANGSTSTPAAAAPAAGTNSSAAEPQGAGQDAKQEPIVQHEQNQKPLQQNTAPELTISLLNHTGSNPVYCYITGTNSNGQLFLLQADGRTPYLPPSPSSTVQPLGVNCAIPLAAPNEIVNVTIPYLSGARLWVSEGQQLTFYLNPGPSLVEPSVTNPSDPNLNHKWDFCEFTYNSGQLYANISYVDFVSIPIALTLNSSGAPQQHVSGMDQNGLTNVCNGLEAQTAKDGRRWSSLIIRGSGGQILRAISPNNGIVQHPGYFSLGGGYWSEYVNEVWNKYRSSTLRVDTQTGAGVVGASVGSNNELNFPNGISFAMPSTDDIFSNSTGPFAVTSTEQGALVARLAAGFNRSTLLLNEVEPNTTADPSQYYQNPITNHYARLVHQFNLDGRGYAFPYDDVTPSGGKDQSGYVSSGSPTNLLVGIGGIGAHT